MTIISASYKTDIPAFYGKWFTNRLNAGYCGAVNPYSKKPYRVILEREAVDGFVFWTKNLGPFIGTLEFVHDQGYPFVIQYTITGYPRCLESSVVDAWRAVSHMREIANRFGTRVAVWRYDTILFSSVTPLEFHRQNFSALAEALRGTTDEVVVSFAQFYRKTQRNMTQASKKSEFTWEDPPDDVKLSLAAELAEIAHSHRMQLTMCSQNQYLAPGVDTARCVDIHRLSDIAGHVIEAPLKPNRPDCGCYASRDIGDYDTCPHGCVYCYAVRDRELARKRFREHNPSSEFLYTPAGISNEVEDNDNPQMKLF